MPQFQTEALATVIHQLPELVKQLKIANQLKALELKSAGHYSVSPEMIDDIMKR